MTFLELVNSVITETGRPDMGLLSQGGSGEIPQTIRATLLKLHSYQGMFFDKDILTAQVKFDTSAYIQTLDTTLPRYRAMAYLRKNDPTLASYQQNPNTLLPLLAGVDGQQPLDSSLALIKPVKFDDIFDEYGNEKFDIMYQAGATIFIKSSTLLLWGLVGWYAFPNTTVTDLADGTYSESQFDSWIAREYPFAIIYDAASAIFVKKGQQEEARKMDNSDPRNPGLVVSHITAMLNSNVVMQGY